MDSSQTSTFGSKPQCLPLMCTVIWKTELELHPWCPELASRTPLRDCGALNTLPREDWGTRWYFHQVHVKVSHLLLCHLCLNQSEKWYVSLLGAFFKSQCILHHILFPSVEMTNNPRDDRYSVNLGPAMIMTSNQNYVAKNKERTFVILSHKIQSFFLQYDDPY